MVRRRLDSSPSSSVMQPVQAPRRRWVVVVLLLILVAATSIYIPIPLFFAYQPGPVRDIEQLVEVSKKRTYSSEGTLYLTTVSLDTEVTLFDWIQAAIDPAKKLVLKKDVTGGSSLQQLEEQQRIQMTDSKQHAEEVALAALGIASPRGDGALIKETVEGAPADGVLKQGDVIWSVEGKRVFTTCDVGRAVDAAGVGERVEIMVRRDQRLKKVSLVTESNPHAPGSPYVGVLMEEINYRFDPGVEVDFKTGEIAGPSAGLMFSLGLYDRLTPEDLTRGRDVAGTGTIACDGDVGPIGGIEQKVAAAEQMGAEIFLAPAANAEAAETAADEIEVVSISTFDDALGRLEALE